MKKIKIAIIILTYNSQFFIKKCINSLKENYHPDYELNFFIIDNASSDKTPFILKDMTSKNIHITLNEINSGFASGVNQGIKQAKETADPKYYLIFNPDAQLEKNSLKKMVDAMLKNPSIGALSPRIIDAETKKNIFLGGVINQLKMRNGHLTKKGAFDYLTGCSLFINNSVINKGIFFDEDFFLYYEDADFCLKIKKAGLKLKIIPSAVCLHKESQSSDSETKTYHLSKNGLLFFHKNSPRFLMPYFWLIFYARFFYHKNLSKKKPVIKGMLDFKKFAKK